MTLESARLATARGQNIANIQAVHGNGKCERAVGDYVRRVTNNALISGIEIDQQARWTQGGNDHGSRKWFNIARIARWWRCSSNG
jgi:hypothetical protein